MNDTKKNTVRVLIGGENIELVSAESEEYISNIAQYINLKIADVQKRTKSVSINSNMMNLLVTINVADELFKERETANRLSDELRACNNELSLTLEENRKIQVLLEQQTKMLDDAKKELKEFLDTFQ